MPGITWSKYVFLTIEEEKSDRTRKGTDEALRPIFSTWTKMAFSLAPTSPIAIRRRGNGQAKPALELKSETEKVRKQ